MTKKSQAPNVNSLFGAAEAKGALSQKAANTLNIVDLGAQIQAGLGISVDDVEASQVILVTQLVDDSGSIRFKGNTQEVRDGHNMIIEEVLKESKEIGDVLTLTRYLNGTVLFPYSPIDQAVLLDQHNYDPNGGTPLYDESVVLLGTVLAKAEEFAQSGVMVRTLTLITTDGNDEGSYQFTASDVAAVAKDMLKEGNHIIAAIGIDDGYTDFRQVFREMGISDEWVYTTKPEPGETEKDHRHRIRRAFQLVSKSFAAASKSSASFSQVALGGFGTQTNKD